MDTSNNNYNQYLYTAKQLFKDEKSYPSVYRHLIKTVDPDIAIEIILQLQKINKEDKVLIN